MSYSSDEEFARLNRRRMQNLMESWKSEQSNQFLNNVERLETKINQVPVTGTALTNTADYSFAAAAAAKGVRPLQFPLSPQSNAIPTFAAAASASPSSTPSSQIRISPASVIGVGQQTPMSVAGLQASPSVQLYGSQLSPTVGESPKTHCIKFLDVTRDVLCYVCGVDIANWDIGDFIRHTNTGSIYEVTDSKVEQVGYVKFFVLSENRCIDKQYRAFRDELEKIKKEIGYMSRETPKRMKKLTKVSDIVKLQNLSIRILNVGTLNATLVANISPIQIGYIIVDSLRAFDPEFKD